MGKAPQRAASESQLFSKRWRSFSGSDCSFSQSQSKVVRWREVTAFHVRSLSSFGEKGFSASRTCSALRSPVVVANNMGLLTFAPAARSVSMIGLLP